MAKCLLLLSGGLDSMLAARILKEQKVRVTPVCFESFFFNCQKAKVAAKELGLRLRVVDFGKEHLKVVKSPDHGWGKNMNPCFDCHLLMLKEAKKIMRGEGYDFIATGEVLGERPFSQNKEALSLIEKEAGLRGFLLRPLSAKLLPETIPEKKGQVGREKLLAIKGRSRRPQLGLAKRFKIKSFPSPAGGCILTDPKYSQRLRKLLEKAPGFSGQDAKLIRKGRVFWEGRFLIVVGRNQEENKGIVGLREREDVLLEPDNFPGPTVLVRGFDRRATKEIREKGKEFLFKYSKKLSKDPKIHEV